MEDRIIIDHYQALSKRIKWADGTPYWTKSNDLRVKIGSIAGYIDLTKGYRRISVTANRINVLVYAHRLIWYMTHGTLPKMLDHINRDREDNRIENLRMATRSQNKHNSKKHKNASSKYKGVSFMKDRSKWQARITFDRKTICLGFYPIEKEAAQAYDNAVDRYNLGEYCIKNIIKEN